MHEDMRKLLNPYLDGELHGSHLRELERHLDGCKACQNELKELRQVSRLLKAAPAPEFTPAERFAANLTLSLPRRSVHEQPRKFGSLAWWLVLAGLVAAWFFIQTVIALTDTLTVTQLSGLLGQAGNWLAGGQETVWFATATSLFGGHAVEAHPTLLTLNALNSFGVELVEGFLWQALIAFLYLGWLAAWWIYRRPGAVNGAR